MATPKHEGLYAGAAEVDITPWAGVQLSGAVGQKRSAHMIGDRLYAKALVLESGGRKLCIVALDLTIVTRQFTSRIRDTAASRFGFDPDAVMVHAIQTHSAPSVGHFMLSEDFPGIPEDCDWLRGADREYDRFCEERVLEAIETAHAALEPVEMGVGRGIEGRFAFNRRAIGRDGKVFMPGRAWPKPLGPTNILQMEGPIDPEVGVLCLRSPTLAFPAIVVSYTCHPVHVFPKTIVSADWPGALAEELKRAHAGCTPLVLNGCCGNVNPWPPFEPDYPDDHRLMGGALAAVVNKVLETLTFRSDAILDWRACHIKLPLREIPNEDLERSREVLAGHPTPKWIKEGEQTDFGWFMAATMVDLANQREQSSEFDYEIQVFRIGDVAFVGLPGEPFVEGQLKIKLESPTNWTYVVHDVGHYAGYLPIREAYARGGHECAIGNWSRFAPGALETVVDESVRLLREVFPTDSGERCKA